MKISKAVIFQKVLPLKAAFEHASSGKINCLEEVYVKLETDTGEVGFGEVRGNCTYFSGDNTQAVIATVRDVVLPAILGLEATNLNCLHKAIESAVVGNQAAKAVVDIAMHDLAAQIYRVPLYHLLGGKLHDQLPTEENIPFCSLEETEYMAKQLIANGCQFIKIRVGLEPFSLDVARVKKVSELVKEAGLTEKIELAVDANQAWNLKEAIHNINALSRYGVTIVEQPVNAADIYQLKQIKDRCEAKIFADEAAFTIKDLVNLIEAQAIDGLHIKLIKCGGIINALRLCHIAEAHGVDYMIGGMDEGMMAVAAAVQCAAVSNTRLFELNGHCRISADPCEGLKVVNSTVFIPAGAGLGVTVAEHQLDRLYEITYKS